MAPHCKTWEKKAVKNIAQDVLDHFPKDLLGASIKTTHKETIAYFVQYKETAWQLLTRLATTYGEWLYFDGRQLVLGSPHGGEAKLVYGSDLQHFNITLQAKPASFKMMAYDYMNNEVYDGKPEGVASKAGLNELGKHVLQKSETLYNTQPKQWHNQFLTNKKQLDDTISTRAAMQSSSMVSFEGSTSSPSLQLGGSVKIDGKNVASQADESFGAYTITTISHQCDGHSNYSNHFVGIPASVKMPPATYRPGPNCETQSALVVENNDPNGLGRVRVKFHWMGGSEKTPWIRVTTPHAGGGKGMFFIPEKGEEVIVGFEGDSPTKPYVIGSVYHGKAKNEFANAGNDVKTFQSRSGNKMVLNDKDGSVHITDKGGADTLMDGAGNITTNASAKAAVNVGGKEGEPPTSFMTMDADGNIVIDGKKSITIKVGDNVFTISKDGISANASEGDVTLEASAKDIKIMAKGNLSYSGKKVAGKADEEMKLAGGNKFEASSSDSQVI
jgi:type VI secretion system secreted protein VgrG